MSCGKCKAPECSGQCEMDRYFKGLSDERLLYTNSGFRETPIGKDLEAVEELAYNLPDVDYILDSIVNYMFTNDLTVGDNNKDKELEAFLNKTNFNGQRNYQVLKEVAKGYRKYGYYGLLSIDGGLIGVRPENIVAVMVDYQRAPVLRQTLSYIIKRDGLGGAGRAFSRITGNINLTGLTSLDEETYLDIIRDPKKYENDYLVVDEKTFACVRLDTSLVFGVSPLLKDRKRVKLILNILDRMNYDISRNGIGTIALQAKNTLEEQVSESVEQGSAFTGGELLDLSRSAKQDREKKIMEDIQQFADELSKTEFNDAIVYTSNFQNLEQLKRDTKATDFLEYLSMYVSAIVCQLFGVPARLFDIGKTVSNIGTHSIIDNAMKNNIIPMRNDFMGQISTVLRNAWKDEDIRFSSYEFTNNYNFNNDLYILDVYDRLKAIDPHKAEQYLDKNLIV